MKNSPLSTLTTITDILQDLSTSSSRQKKALDKKSPRTKNYRLLTIESLETRQMLNAAPVIDLSDFYDQLSLNSATGEYTYNIAAGSPWYVPLTATDADGDTVYYTVTSSNSSLTTSLSTATEYVEGNLPTVEDRNKFWKITVFQEGNADLNNVTMTFELFEDQTPKTTAQYLKLSEENFYDNSTFHRVIQDFMSQAGISANGYSAYSIDDEFVEDLRMTTVGMLAAANAGNDTNTSQFFITNKRTAWLDFEHTVFGFLNQGFSVQETLNNVAVTNSVPTTTVRIVDTEEVVNYTNSTLKLKTAANLTLTSVLTITAYDQYGNASEPVTLNVSVKPDTDASANTVPFLTPDIPSVSIETGATDSFTIMAKDVEGDTIWYGASLSSTDSAVTIPTDAVKCDQLTGVVTINAEGIAPGVYDLYLGVTASTRGFGIQNSDGSYTEYGDRQHVPLYVLPKTPTKVTLLATDDTGTSSSDGITSDKTKLTFQVEGCTKGTTVYLYSGETELGSGEVLNENGVVTIQTSGAYEDGRYQIYAKQIIPSVTVDIGNSYGTVNLESAWTTDPCIVVVETDDLAFSKTAAEMGVLAAYKDQQFSYTFQTTLVDSFVKTVYGISGQPEGMTIDPTTGTVTWTPSADDMGMHSFTVTASDALGHDISMSVKVSALDPDNLHAPVITAPSYTDDPNFEPTQLTSGDQIVMYEHQPLELQFTGVDDDGDTLTWSVSPDNIEGLTIDSTGKLTWTPSEAYGGKTTEVTVYLLDSGGASDTFVLKLAVEEVQDPPVFAPVNTQLAVPGETLIFQVEASNPDNLEYSTTIYYSLNIVDENNVVSALNEYDGLSVNSSTGMVTWQVPSTLAAGEYTLKVCSYKNILGESSSSSQTSGSTILQSTQDIQVLVLDSWDSVTMAGKPSLQLHKDSDTGASNSDFITNPYLTSGKHLLFGITGLTKNSLVILYADGTMTNSLFSDESEEIYMADAMTSPSDKTYTFTTRQIIKGQTAEINGQTYTVDLPSSLSEPVAVTYDTHKPVFTDWAYKSKVLEGIVYTDQITATDTNPIASYSLVSGPDGLTVSTTGAISWTPEITESESVDVTVMATDAAGNAETFTYTISIVPGPEFTPIADQTIHEPAIDYDQTTSGPWWSMKVEAFDHTNTGSDNGSESGSSSHTPSTITLVSAPDGMTLSYDTTKEEYWLQWTPGENQDTSSSVAAGFHTVVLKAESADGALKTTSFKIMVLETNTVPEITSQITAPIANEGLLTSLTFTAVDLDQPTQKLTWSLGDNAPAGMSIDPDTGVLSWTPTEAQGGNQYTVSVEVTDSVDSARQSVVFSVNAAPSFTNLTDQTIDEKSMLDYTIIADGADYFELTGAPDATGFEFDTSTGRMTWTTTESDGPATFTMTVKAYSAEGAVRTKSFTLTINEVNTPPLIQNVLDSVFQVYENDRFSYDFIATDEDQPQQQLTWTLEGSVPDGMTINSSTGQLTWTPSEYQGGESFTVTVCVNDSVTTTRTEMNFDVIEVDSAPVFQAPVLPSAAVGQPGTVFINTTAKIQFTAADPDIPANDIQYSLVNGPEGAQLDPLTGAFTWSIPEEYQPGEISITVRATEMVGALSTGVSTDITVELEVLQYVFIPEVRPTSPYDRDDDTQTEVSVGVDESVLLDIMVNSPQAASGYTPVVWTLDGEELESAALRKIEQFHVGAKFGFSLGELRSPVQETTTENKKNDSKSADSEKEKPVQEETPKKK